MSNDPCISRISKSGKSYKLFEDVVMYGNSRAGKQTGFYIPAMETMLDFGILCESKFKYGFITHSHSDHTQFLPQMVNASRTNKNIIFAPRTIIGILTSFQRSHYLLNHPETILMTDSEFLEYVNVEYRGVEPGDRFHIESKGKIYEVDIFESYHSVESVGYGFTQIERIKEEQLARRLEKCSTRGIRFEIDCNSKDNSHVTISTPRFVFFADSSIRNLLDHNGWKPFPVIINECTGVHEDDISKYIDITKNSHTHLMELIPIIRDNPEHKWILIHLGMSVQSDKIDRLEYFFRQERLNVTLVHT